MSQLNDLRTLVDALPKDRTARSIHARAAMRRAEEIERQLCGAIVAVHRALNESQDREDTHR